MREAFNNTCIKVQSNPRERSFSIIAQYGSVVTLAIQRSYLADHGDTQRSNVSAGGTQELPYGKQVLVFIPYTQQTAVQLNKLLVK